MPSSYVPSDIFPSLSAVADGDAANAVNLNLLAKGVADRSLALKNALQHLTGADLTASAARTTTAGARRLLRVASTAALGALVVGASDDGATVEVDGLGLYQYRHGLTTAAGLLVQIQAAGGVGRWDAVGLGVSALNAAGGIPQLGILTFQVPTTTVPNRFHDHNESNSGIGNTTRSSRGAVSLATFTNGTGNLPLLSRAAGDIVDAAYSGLASINPSTVEGYINLVAIEGASTTVLDTIHLTQENVIVPVRLGGKYVVSAAGTVTIRCQIRVQTGGVGQINLFNPEKFSARTFRL